MHLVISEYIETTEMRVHPKITRKTLTPAAQKFILRWGVNLTVAQVHALLFLSSRPPPAEEIAETLAVARSNVSIMDCLPDEIHMGACSVKISDFSRERL